MGLIQGVTELFPVSSLGHGVLVPALLGWHNLVSSQTQTESFFLVVLVTMHVGTALGLVVFYRRTWARLLGGLVTQVRQTPTTGVRALWDLRDPQINPHYRLLVLLALGSIPVGLVGLVLQSKLRELFAKPLDTAVFLVINGVILLIGEWMLRSRGRHARARHVSTLSAGRALGIGSSEVLALLAGISRSGVTMVAGLANGLDHEESANFSFLLATPVILLAGLDKLPALFGPLGHGVRAQALVGALVALVSAYGATRFLTKWFKTRTLTPFALYCLAAGALCVLRFY
jgi:undecaprenyl-diphosphatase